MNSDEGGTVRCLMLVDSAGSTSRTYSASPVPRTWCKQWGRTGLWWPPPSPPPGWRWSDQGLAHGGQGDVQHDLHPCQDEPEQGDEPGLAPT